MIFAGKTGVTVFLFLICEMNTHSSFENRTEQHWGKLGGTKFKGKKMGFLSGRFSVETKGTKLACQGIVWLLKVYMDWRKY